MKLKKLIAISSLITLVFIQCDEPVSHSEEAVTQGNIGFTTADSTIPYYGPIDKDGTDTLFYQIPKFYLIDQDSVGFGNSYYKDSYMVVDFFFTTCSTICPIMTSEMSSLQRELESQQLMGTVKFLSVTIDPEADTPSTLKTYAEKNEADQKNWKFATADIEYIDELSKEGFFLAVDRNASYQDGIIHSSQLILVDPNRHVRGSYDGIDPEEMGRLLSDIKTLVNE